MEVIKGRGDQMKTEKATSSKRENKRNEKQMWAISGRREMGALKRLPHPSTGRRRLNGNPRSREYKHTPFWNPAIQTNKIHNKHNDGKTLF